MAKKRTWVGSKSVNISLTSHNSTVRSPGKSTMNVDKKVAREYLLKNIVADLKMLKDCVSKTVKSDDLKSVIILTIIDLLKEHKAEIRELLDEKTRGPWATSLT
jgi:hypothetical protein